MLSRPADSRTIAFGIVMRATAMVRTNSSGIERFGAAASGVPSTCTRLLIGTLSGYGSRFASCAISAGAVAARLAHADDAAAAHVDARAAHALERVEPVVGSRAW